jgi:CII-binding regulator of phage lambda lysogenization HflD
MVSLVVLKVSEGEENMLEHDVEVYLEMIEDLRHRILIVGSIGEGRLEKLGLSFDTR